MFPCFKSRIESKLGSCAFDNYTESYNIWITNNVENHNSHVSAMENLAFERQVGLRKICGKTFHSSWTHWAWERLKPRRFPQRSQQIMALNNQRKYFHFRFVTGAEMLGWCLGSLFWLHWTEKRREFLK